MAVIAIVAGILVVGAGIVSTAVGEREFEHHEPEGAESHGEEEDAVRRRGHRQHRRHRDRRSRDERGREHRLTWPVRCPPPPKLRRTRLRDDAGAGKLYTAAVVLWLLAAAAMVFFIVGTNFWHQDAPLNTFNPLGTNAQTIQDLVTPVFVIAGVVFLVVEGLVLFVSFRNRKSVEEWEADTDFPEQSHGNTKLEILWTATPAAHPRRPRGAERGRDPRAQRLRRHRDGGRGRGPAVVVAVQVRQQRRRRVRRRGRHHHRQRAGDPGRHQRRDAHHLQRRHPLVLDPRAQRQEGRRPQHGEQLEAPGRRARPLPRHLHRVLRALPRPHADVRHRPRRRRSTTSGKPASWPPRPRSPPPTSTRPAEFASYQAGQAAFAAQCTACHVDPHRDRDPRAPKAASPPRCRARPPTSRTS